MVLKMSFNPENSIAHIADSAGVGPRSVDRWLALYRSRGLEAVLTRGTDKNRRPSKINDEILDYLNKGLESQRWNTLVEATEALTRKFDQPFEYKTVWYWVKKCTEALRIPLPVHEKRDPAKAETFKRTVLGKLKHCHSKEVSQ